MFIKDLRKLLKVQKTDAVLINSFKQIQYILNLYRTIPSGEAYGNLLVTNDNLFLVMDPLGKKLVQDLVPRYINLIEGDSLGYISNRCFYKELYPIIKKNNIKSLSAFFSIKDVTKTLNWGKLKFKFPNENPILKIANTSTLMEQKYLKIAAKIVDDTFNKILGEIKEGMKEIDLRNRIDDLMYSFGAQSTTFPTIVGFGEHTNQIHAICDSRKLKKGDLVMVDYGAMINGVGSDITRTFVFGKASKEQRAMWKALYASQKKSCQAIKPGVSGRKIDAISRDVLAEHGFQPGYIHTLGHQLGLLKGSFGLTPWEKGRIKKNMLLTVEPGIYTKIGGIRIEDDILVTSDGCKVLTKAPKPMEL